MDSKMRGIVRCESYNELWKVQFFRIKDMLIECIGDLIIDIEHFGSTSIEGLIAKPIIDIDIVFDSYTVFPMITNKLKTIGFIHEGDCGVKSREAFKRNYEDEYMPYHLYACPKDSKELLRHLSFREYLKANANEREAYGNLKMDLVKRFPEDIDFYMAGKNECVRCIYEKIENNSMLFTKYPL